MGELLQCGCEATRSRAPPRPPAPGPGDPPGGSAAAVEGGGGKWEWGGCGDDVEFGYEKSKQFMDAKRRRGKSDIRALVDLHNNEAGRLACSMGELLQCGCEATRSRAPPRPPAPSPGDHPGGSAAVAEGGGGKWEWGGCGDDVEFGYEKSKQFMDAKRRRGKSDIRALVDLHNNEAGRLKMAPFREVGDRLLERFNGASKVMGGNDGKTLIPVGADIKPPDCQDLIYSAESPDFCVANRKTGSLGTRGRTCNSTAPDVSGCDLLCCERGFRRDTLEFEENCLCRFHWCCVVQCKKCSVRKELSLCH
ncbi:hypothetical protein CRUP_008401 [Coryphaenoides rupestris]|nr:hypothetical protein CRUP_008401 [Coryphaenoides rupestris]